MLHEQNAHRAQYEYEMTGRSCQWPAVLERFAIPRNAKETSRGWVWYEDLDWGDPEVGPQPNVVRMTLPRALCKYVVEGVETVVLMPQEVAEERNIRTWEESARQRVFNAWGEYMGEVASSAVMDDWGLFV